MFSSLKSLVTTPLSWFANATNESFETDDIPGKRKLVHSAANSYDDEGDKQDAPSAYRVKRIRLYSPERVDTLPTAPTSYLDPPTPSLRALAHPRSHAFKPARPYAPSNNTIPIPRPDTSRLSPISFNPPPRAQAVPGARTMSMDPPTARRTSVQEPSYFPPPISRDVSMENSPNPSTQPANPAFRMRSSLTPQPGAPLYGPNPQRRERNPSEPPPLTALIENPIFVKPPSTSQDNRRVNDGPSSLTLGSLVDTQKSQNPSTNRSHSVLVLRPQADGLRATNAAEIALQELERYRTPLVPTRLGLANVDVAIPGLFQARKKARALVLMKRDKRDDKPRLGHASKYINYSKDKDKDTPSKNKNNKPYAGEGGLKKLLARRKQEVIEAESVEDPDAQAMIDDNERELERPKRTSKIAEPVRSPATFARKVSAPPSSFVSMTGRKLAHSRTSRARTVGPTRTRNRFTAAYEDDEPDGADDLTTMPEEPSKEKESVSASLPKFEPPSGFSFAPPPSVTSIPQAPDTSSQDEPPISALPFTFSKTPMPTITIPAPAVVTQPPTIALVPPTPEGPQMDKPVSERTPPDFLSTSQTSVHTGVTPPQSDSNSTSKPEPKPVHQAADEPTAVSKSETGATTSESPASHARITPAQTLEAQGPSLAPFNFGPTPATLPRLTSSTQPTTTTSLPFSLTPSSAEQPSGKKDDAGVAPPKPLFGGATSSFPGFGTPVSASAPSTKPAIQSVEASTAPFSFQKLAKPAAAESVEPLKPGFFLAPSPSLMPVSVSKPAPPTEGPNPPKLSTPFSFDQPAKETTTAAPSTPAKNIFTFGASSTTPSTAEKPAVTSTGFAFGSSTTTPASALTGLSFGSPATQSETKPAASTGGFSFGTPASADATKPAFSFGVTTLVRSSTPPPADDGMRMEESPTRGGGMDVNGGSAKPQSLPQLQMPGSSKPGFSFGTSTGTGFGSPLSSPFGGNSGSGFTIGQQNQPSSQGASGGFTFDTNKKSSGSINGGFSFPATKPAENPTGSFSQPVTDAKPSPSTGFSFGQQGPKTADATSSGFSFKAPEPIQHSTSFTFGQTLPEPTRPSSAGFTFGNAPPQQSAANTSFAFNSPASGGAFGSAPASPAFGTQPLAPASSTPFSFAGPTSAPPQQPAPNPFGFGSGSGQPTSPAVQQGFTFNYGGTPSTPTGQFGASPPQIQTPDSSGSAIFTMGAPSSQAAPLPGQRVVRKLPTRRNANARR